MYQTARPIFAFFSFLFISVPSNAGWPTSIIIWFVRIATISLILRTYIIPWLLARMSDHIRVRSISLRSIRGLYFRNGGYTWRVERIGYAFSSVQGSRRLAIKIDGPSLHITKDDDAVKQPTKRRHNRNLTLADFNPSPLARHAWSLLSTVKNFLEPYLRPFIRTYVVACIRVSIQWLPRLTQALSFDVHSVTVTFNDIPGAKILAEEISLNASLSLTYIEQSLKSEEVRPAKDVRNKQPSYGVAAWKKRMADSLQRSFDKALGESRGTGVISLRICNILGTIPRSSDADALSVPFLISPGVIDLGVSAKFNPKEAALDTHGLKVSLKMGDCSAKVDLLNLLLDKALPKKPSEPTVTLQSPSASYANTPLGSSFSIGSMGLGGLPSPAQSFASSFFSPTSMFSPSNLISSKPTPMSPNSTRLPSPRSPSSPFLQAISASMRPRRHFLIQPPAKLKDFKDKSQLSVLHSVHIHVAAISLSVLSQKKTGPYKAIIKDISVDLALSDPSTNLLHQSHLGSRRKTDVYDLDSYAFKATFRQITLERESRHHIVRLARLGSFALQILAFQWPAPFLSPSSFLDNDPNSPFLGIHMELANIHMSERIQDLQQFLERVPVAPEQCPEPQTPTTPPVDIQSFPIPRIYFAVKCGPIIGRIIYDADNGAKHRAIELRNNGFTVSSNAVYQHPSSAIRRTFPAASSVQPLHFEGTLVVNLEPILVRVRSKHNFIGIGEPEFSVHDEEFLDDPPLLSLGMVEITASVNAVAQMDGAAESIAVIDRTSLVADFSMAFDNISVELWHPISVDAALRVLSIIPSKQTPIVSSNPRPRFSKLPLGLATKLAIARFLVFVTAPDISPTDNMDLSRGFALRTSTSVEYCSLRPNQDHWFDNIRRSKKRTLLWLPSEIVTHALSSAKAYSPPGDRSGFIKFRLNNLILRAAVATQFEPDEPTFVGREDLSNSLQELLRVDSAVFDIYLSCKASIDHSQTDDFCDISGQIPLVKADFHLAHVYSILLGLQTIRLINPPRSSQVSENIAPAGRKMVFSMQGTVTAIQGTIALPTQNLLVRMDGLTGYINSQKPPRLQWTKANVFVSLPAQVNRWEEPVEGRWDEFVSLQAWEITFTQVADSLCISVDGDSAHLRIPHGFVLAHLVHDASVAVKAIKHLSHMASAGCYSDTPSPEPEGPKSVPPLTIRLTSLCLEAQDDPFETKLGLIWRTGADAVKQRMDREEAFKAKVEAVLSAELEIPSTNPTTTDAEHEFQFDATHSVSIQEARARLDAVHALDWTLRLEQARKKRSKEENTVLHTLFGPFAPVVSTSLLEPMRLPPTSSEPPLLRAMLQNICLTISPPTFSLESLPDALHKLGSGLPRDTKFSLLVPLHIHFTLSGLRVTLRDYPLPLLNIFTTSSSSVCWTFDTDFVVGEEMGTEASVDWVTCPIIDTHHARHGESPFSILIPKTIMPVKTYAAPVITVITPEPTVLSWGVSYGPAIQDVMRIVDTLSSSPRDSSPALGFWDKIRLVFHWTFKITFCGDVRLYIKGSRDPYKIDGPGSGFVLCWQGSPEIRVGYENPQRELIQVMSDGMLIAVPDLKSGANFNNESAIKTKPFEKVCARLSSGVRYGIGFLLERSCGPECPYENCSGSPFHRQCRYFSFRPHYDVKLEMKASPPSFKSQDDSYNGFRSDFIHLSLSLASSIKTKGQSESPKTSNLYLTPKVFAHFWSWCSLFEGTLTLPIRQGDYHPPRPITPKLGRHLATLKYRISLHHLYVLHGYIDEARETWVDGVTPWVGLKGKVDELQADLHQREEESTVPGPIPDTTRIVRRKPFYAAEVITKGLELRALLAIFSEPMKQHAGVSAPSQRSNYRQHANLPVTRQSSIWFDLEDFVELDWTPPANPPVLHLLPLAACPHFTYFKRNESLSGSPQTSKFGSEHSHICLLGKEPSVLKTQISLATSRATELRKLININPKTGSKTPNPKTVMKMVTLLEEYINVLKEVEIKPESAQEKASESYHIPAEIVSSEEWAEFDNVYQIHCPSIFMDSAVRDIVIQYYYCSRDRRGFEYHMATRAVKFIRDQAKVAFKRESTEEDEHIKSPTNAAQLAASALRKMLKGENIVLKTTVDIIRNSSRPDPTLRKIDPLEGWAESVSLRKSNCCLLLKPQVVLRGEGPADTCIVAAAQAKLQSFAIMDPLNADDPINGNIMSRNFTSLAGLQVFSPTNFDTTAKGSVPLEVLVDLRCESDAFERLVPQTDAIFHYDKFNRLRLRNDITSIVTKPDALNATINDSHLQNQTDLIRVHIPRFTVSANSEHLEAISNIVTKLLLFSDPAHKIRLDRLETLIFTYDFTDLNSASQVVSRLQSRLRSALETERHNSLHLRRLDDEDARLNMLQLKAHIFSLSEELNLLFDSIKMAQDRFDDQADQKSALLLHASSSEISWRMLDSRRNLLSKLVVSDIHFHWLSRQDSSTVNNLTIGNLTAFDGSRYALWAEILSKYDEPPNHPLLKRGLFLSANWVVLAPVGGITIYETFELSFHPLRLQIDAKVGRRIREYVWPDRKERRDDAQDKQKTPKPTPEPVVKSPGRSSFDSPRTLQTSEFVTGQPTPALRKLGSSRSFTDLRSSAREESMMDPAATLNPQGFLSPPAFLKRTHSTDSVNFGKLLDAPPTPAPGGSFDLVNGDDQKQKGAGDAQVMKNRSSQKSFVLVRISSLHLLLSVVKEGSFECHDAKIKTRELEYRNQTWSFEELVNEFIPSDMSWRGWIKMAFHQPLVPVLPVARELLAKTRWTASKTTQAHDSPLMLLHPQIFSIDDDRRLTRMQTDVGKRAEGSKSGWRNALRTNKDPPSFTSLPLTAEPEPIESEPRQSGTSNVDNPLGRKRVKSLFSNKNLRQSPNTRESDKRRSEELLKGNP